MLPNFLDWSIVGAFLLLSLVIGLISARQASKSASNFFLSGRSMPWWLLGVSMVATTFSADTPNLVTDIVRQNGVSGNWVWWAFLLTGMLTVFVYAKLWRRLGVSTDIEFYELRYSGGPAAFLRGFRAVYLGVFFNVLIMASVTLAAIKIAGAMLGLSAVTTILIASLITVAYSLLGGLKGVLLTDLFQFVLAMVGSVAVAFVVLNLPEVGGLNGLLTHEAVQGKLSFFPDFSNTELVMTILIIPIAVQWWSVWYPGAEPGGGGYIAQRMLAAKDERHATGATLFFNVAHYALRPWPWIIVALASLIVFPDLDSLREAFPNMDESRIKHDFGYPAMLTFLPHGLFGVVLASMLAAFTSTISTHLNWGSSYVVNDVYKRFVNPEAEERKLVLVGRISTVALMVLAGALALWLENSLQAFQILLQVGAGTGLLFILRWFWWRINAYSELTAMAVSFFIAIYFEFFYHGGAADWQKLCIGVGITTAAWIAATILTRPTDTATLRSFCRAARPGGPGWTRVMEQAAADGEPIELEGPWSVPTGILCMVAGCFGTYSALFATGFWLYGNIFPAAMLTVVAVVAFASLVALWNKAVCS